MKQLTIGRIHFLIHLLFNEGDQYGRNSRMFGEAFNLLYTYNADGIAIFDYSKPVL